MSLPSRGAWIEIQKPLQKGLTRVSRSPHGERGLKSVDTSKVVRLQTRRSPHGERGLKFACGEYGDQTFRRSPHGERGLKFEKDARGGTRYQSLPSRGAWIEIRRAGGPLRPFYMSLPSRGAWIEISSHFMGNRLYRSLPSRGAWIEITAVSN